MLQYWKHLCMSFIKIMNNKGPNIDPCGTPEVTGTKADSKPLMTTFCVRLEM